MLEGALPVGGISIATLIITRFKCLVKKNGVLNYSCGCLDKPLFDDDELEIKQVDLGDVKILYVKPKHIQHHHYEELTDDDK